MKIFVFAIILLIILISPSGILAQTGMQTQPETLEAKVVNIIEEKKIDVSDAAGLEEPGERKKQLYQKLELLVKKGSLSGQKIQVENGNLPMTNILRFKTGDEVVVTVTKDLEGNNRFYISDYIRRQPLLWLFIIFAALTVFIGRWRGLTSLIGMAISFVIIFMLILPQILAGRDPVLVSILGSLFIIPVIFYLSHGVNKKTTVAIFGTFISLIITGILANLFVEVSKLTGFVSEEASFLQVAKQGAVNIKGLLLAGIIIGVLGVLDDVTVAQAAVVQQLKEANNNLKPHQLFKRAMDVGQDHIASMVNTLVLVYAGAAMPLLLLFVNNPLPFSQVINYEIVSSEIIRTLVGSIGLISAVPITTYIASLASRKQVAS